MQDSAHKESRTACLGVLIKLFNDFTEEYQTDAFTEYQTECLNNPQITFHTPYFLSLRYPFILNIYLNTQIPKQLRKQCFISITRNIISLLMTITVLFVGLSAVFETGSLLYQLAWILCSKSDLEP